MLFLTHRTQKVLILAGLVTAFLPVYSQVLQDDPALLAPKSQPDNITPQSLPKILQGGVSTFESAVAAEQDVDWYRWYLDCRNYLAATGGLNCRIGTQLKIYKNGLMEALTEDTACVNSAGSRMFALPKATALDAIILPVRNGKLPPASRSEFLKHLPPSQ
ncbi:MAG: hypothetical protein K2X01_04820 [Cyanobacteria bacterium]|nr:hypothetical protein [Cyanobacteriota bacterium]